MLINPCRFIKKNEQYLADKCCDPNYVVYGICEQTNKDISLAVDFSCVDFVEKSHHYKRIKNHGKMLCWWRAQVTTFTVVNIEDYVTCNYEHAR